MGQNATNDQRMIGRW